MVTIDTEPSGHSRETNRSRRANGWLAALSCLSTVGVLLWFVGVAQAQQFTPVYRDPGLPTETKTIYFEAGAVAQEPPPRTSPSKSLEFDIPPKTAPSQPPRMLPQPTRPIPNYAVPPVPSQTKSPPSPRSSRELPTTPARKRSPRATFTSQSDGSTRVPPRPRTLEDVRPIPLPDRSVIPTYPTGGGFPRRGGKKPAPPEQSLAELRTRRSALLTQRDFPGPEELFRLESERTFKERLEQEARDNNEFKPLLYPTDPVISEEPYQPRRFPRRVKLVEPAYVCYNRPFFEQLNFDRYGWDVGPATPVLQLSKFYWDVFFLPYHAGTQPFRHYESNAGYCLPGDPVPFYIYPPKLSVTGTLMQGIAIGGGYAVFQ